jgi:hypothetical protein
MSSPPRRSLYRSFLSIVDVFPVVPFTASLIPFDCRYLSRHTACWIARFFCVSTSSPPCRSMYLSFLSLVNVFPAVLLTASFRLLIYVFSVAPRAKSLVLSLVDVLPAAPLPGSLVSFACHVFPATPLSASLISFAYLRLNFVLSISNGCDNTRQQSITSSKAWLVDLWLVLAFTRSSDFLTLMPCRSLNP